MTEQCVIDHEMSVTEMQTNKPLPKEISEAIMAVMAGVPKLARSEENTQGKYMFAGIDAFLEAVRPLCVEAGLIISQNEVGFETLMIPQRAQGLNNEEAAWFKLRYQFCLSHKSGVTWDERPERTIAVRAAMGSQAFGAAQSYALKLFMRSLFQIATGDDEDIDREPEPKKRGQAKPALHGKLSITELKAKLREFVHDVNSCTDLGSLVSLEEGFREVSDQAMMDLAEWWYGDGEQKGAMQILDQKRKQLKFAEDDPNKMEPPA